jgi:hypothetical protein
MTIGGSKTDYIPGYDEKIYEFNRADIDNKLKDFLLSNPNM